MAYNTSEETGKSDWKDVQIGICRALEWTLEEAGELVGLSSQAVLMRQRSGKHAKAIAEAKSWTETASAKYLAKRVAAMEQRVEAMRKRLRDKGYSVIEKKLDHALQRAVCANCGIGRVDFEGPGQYLSECPHCQSKEAPVMVEVSASHLAAANIGIEREEGKALQSFKSEHTEKRVIEVNAGDLDDFLGEVKALRGHLQACLPAAPPEIVIESTEPS
jgi:predicted Zn-ribbon and HTH transcriptional regulator